MKIGMILDASFPPDPRVENEAVTLVNAGHKVFLFCVGYTKPYQEENYAGITVCRYSSTTLIYKLSALAYTFPFYRWCMAPKIHHFIKKNEVEALHIHDMRIAETVYHVNRTYGLPVVLDLHDNQPEILKLYPHTQKFPGKYLISFKKWKQKEEECIARATAVLTVSPEFVADIQERTGISSAKIKLVPNTIRASFYTNALLDQSILDRYSSHFVLLYLGDTNLRRGLMTAIESLPKLVEHIPTIKLVIVGTNTTDPILKERVASLGISALVDFEGWQEVALFPSYIQASSVCISPLHRNKQHDVAYANKLFQYMSFEKPLLVSNAKAQADLVTKVGAGLVHQEQDAEDFAKQIRVLYNDTTLREDMGAKGAHFVKQEFSWEQTAHELLTLYSTLAS